MPSQCATELLMYGTFIAALPSCSSAPARRVRVLVRVSIRYAGWHVKVAGRCSTTMPPEWCYPKDMIFTIGVQPERHSRETHA